MTGEQEEPSTPTAVSPTDPTYQLRCATARLEAALQSLDLEAEPDRAEEIITALHALDRACGEPYSPRNSESRPANRASTPSR